MREPVAPPCLRLDPAGHGRPRRQVSWLAGQRPCSAFPVPGGTSDPGAGLAAHSCGYSAGIEPASLFTVPCGSGTFTRGRSEEHTSELQSLMRISYAVFCLKKKKIKNRET